MFGGVLEDVGNTLSDAVPMPSAPMPSVAPTVSMFSSIGLYAAYFFGGLLLFFIVFIIIVVLLGSKKTTTVTDSTDSASGKPTK